MKTVIGNILPESVKHKHTLERVIKQFRFCTPCFQRATFENRNDWCPMCTNRYWLTYKEICEKQFLITDKELKDLQRHKDGASLPSFEVQVYSTKKANARLSALPSVPN